MSETTTLAYDSSVTNDPSSISQFINLLLSLMRGVVNVMQDIKLFANVSLFDFLIALAVMSIVIVYLLNIAKRPYIERTTDSARTEGTASEYSYFWIGFVGYPELPQSSSCHQLPDHRR